MRYGEWLSEAGRLLFRNVYMWVLAAPVLILRWAAQMSGGISIVGLQGRFMYTLNNPLLQRQILSARTPGEVLLALANMYAHVLGIGLSTLLLAVGWSLLAWLFSLVVAGAIIHQALPSHAERPRWQESLHVGLNRAPHLLLIHLILAIPPWLIASLATIVLLLAIFALPTAPHPAGTMGTALGMMWAMVCMIGPLFVVWNVFVALFEPLAIQACVQEVRNAWESLGRAWQVFWRRLGPVILLAVILFVLRLFAGGFSAMASPLTFVLQHVSGGWAVLALSVWAMFALFLTLLHLLVEVFGWTLYARAWPDLKD